ncbi:CBN-SRH-24 protein [Caenorhabditis brenneri]|uniref:CBN-SRH-24 protein n=1 Tax=Caenorhabditis brenneri TaxID=135651 RepID=G0MRI9_CAEBE|nr:CBN-SRH-24 protein [Caenorhabditis brenneri]
MQDGVPGYEIVLHLCTSISVPINLFAIFCIVTQSGNTMKKYKWYLLNVQIWIFLTDLILFILIAPRFYFPLIAGTMHGFFFYIGVPYEVQTIIGFGTGVGMLSACTQAIQYRHCQIVPPNSVLARNSKMKTILNCIRYFLFCQVSVPAVLTEPSDQMEAKLRVAAKYPFHPDFFFDPKVYLLQESPFFVFVPGSLIITYVFIELSFYILQSFRQLNKRVSHMSERTKQLQKKYFVCICVQVLVPFLFCIFPIGFLCFAIVSGYHVQFWNDMAVIVFGLHGTFATLVMLPLYQPYRKFCKTLVCCAFRPFSKVHSLAIM